jgi:hypothetical protein
LQAVGFRPEALGHSKAHSRLSFADRVMAVSGRMALRLPNYSAVDLHVSFDRCHGNLFPNLLTNE